MRHCDHLIMDLLQMAALGAAVLKSVTGGTALGVAAFGVKNLLTEDQGRHIRPVLVFLLYKFP